MPNPVRTTSAVNHTTHDYKPKTPENVGIIYRLAVGILKIIDTLMLHVPSSCGRFVGNRIGRNECVICEEVKSIFKTHKTSCCQNRVCHSCITDWTHTQKKNQYKPTCIYCGSKR